jgi:hypothetical protein
VKERSEVRTKPYLSAANYNMERSRKDNVTEDDRLVLPGSFVGVQSKSLTSALLKPLPEKQINIRICENPL